MVKTACGPQGSFQTGLSYTVDDSLASALIKSGSAEAAAAEIVEVEKPKPKVEVAQKPEPKAETATEPTAPTKRRKYRPSKKADSE